MVCDGREPRWGGFVVTSPLNSVDKTYYLILLWVCLSSSEYVCVRVRVRTHVYMSHPHVLCNGFLIPLLHTRKGTHTC